MDSSGGFKIRLNRFAGCLLVLSFVLALGAVVLLESAFYVQEGTVAVVTQRQEAQTVLDPGLNFKLPFLQDVVVYRTQEMVYETREGIVLGVREGNLYLDALVDTATSDGQKISVAFTVRFRMDAERILDIFEYLGTEQEVVDKLIKANARVRVRNILHRFSAADLSGERVTEAESEIGEQLRIDYEQEGIELIFFGLRSIDFIQN